MKSLKLSICLLLVFVTAISSSACSLFIPDKGSFDGGEILNEELLSEIRAEIFTYSSDTSTESEENTNLSESSSYETEIESENEAITSEETENCDTTSERIEESILTTEETEKGTTSSSGKVVFWTESGSVWHSFKDCGHLKNSKEILSGSVDDAIAAGKEKLCTTCQKKED